jgi:Chaperone of endosialidase
MARKITGGLVGSSTLVGAIQISPDSALSTAADQNITLSPGGTGQVVSTANVQLNAQTDLRFADSDSSNWVGFQAPATVAANVTWTLPATDGSADQVLTTNASGTLSWTSKSVTLTDETASATTHYPLFSVNTSGSVTSVNVSSTKMTYQPSTGRMTLAGAQTASNITSGTLVVTGGVGISGALYVGADIYSYASSDIRLKENLSKIDNSLEKLLRISGYKYHWNKIAQEMYPERTMQDVGVIAQEVKEIVPSAVVEREDGYLAVRYDKLIPLLIEAVKSLKEEIEIMKREN